GRARITGASLGETAHADVQLSGAAIALPSVFERELIPVHSLSTSLHWLQSGGRSAALSVERLRLDAGEEGARTVLEADGVWQPHGGRTRAGSIDLEGHVQRAEVGAVGRFMPRVVGEGLRHWLDTGLTGGTVEAVQDRPAGDLADIPFARPPAGPGITHVSGQLPHV